MSDIVAAAINDLVRRTSAVPAVASRVIYMATQDELLGRTKELSIPCVGVLYSGLRLNAGESRREVSHILSCAVVLLGADLCVHDAQSRLPEATVLLQALRDAVRADPANETEIKWVFESETPVELGSAKRPLLGYVQSWNTNVVLWP